MATITSPLTPPDCDLRDFAFMPLDVVRLRDSDLAATESAESFRSAVLLWCASWHQIPAASLPNDDRILANLAGFGRVIKEWIKIKQGALRGWVICSDGRLYHPVIAEKANEAFRRKLEQLWKTECARIKKHNQRHEKTPELLLPFIAFEEYLSQRQANTRPDSVPRDISKCPDSVPREMPSNRQGDGQGQGNIKTINQSNAGVRDSNLKFAMSPDWRPSDHVADLARQSGTVLLPADLPDMVAHWLTEPNTKRTQAEWDKALLQTAKHRQIRAASPAPPRAGRMPQVENFAEKNYGVGVQDL